MSNEKEIIAGFKATVRGQYHASENDRRVLKSYQLEVFIPQVVEVQIDREWKYFKSGNGRIRRSVPVYKKVSGREYANYVVQRQILPGLLAEKYPDSMGFRTCTITNLTPANVDASEFTVLSGKPIDKMNMTELRQFCALHGLATPLESFTNVEDARIAVSDSYDNLLLSDKNIRRQATKSSDVPEGLEPLDEDELAADPLDGTKVDDDLLS